MSRYIDADKLERKYMEADYMDNDTAYEVIAELDAQPTADVRENVKGEWIKLDEEPVYIIECSECGDKLLNMIGQPLPKFCSNCGADMRPITTLSKNVEIDSNLKRGEHLKNTK